MRIGILTHHYINNFGAFLQAYSLQEALRSMYPNDDIVVINYVNIKHFLINTAGWFRFYVERESPRSWAEKVRLPKTFSKARKAHLRLSKLCTNAKDVNNLHFDYIIVGSDEVWNYRDTKGNASIKFGEGIEKTKLVAYAPSVGGTTESNIPQYVIDGIRRFKAVSARDELTQRLAMSIRGQEITRVLDPTFLTNLPTEPVKNIKKPYVLFYYCDGLRNDQKHEIVSLAKKSGFAVYGAGEADKEYIDLTINLTPFQWVWMFENANFIVTGTFHGVVFSLLNHRQFTCYLANPSRIKKVNSLLKEFNLMDRLSDGTANDIFNILNQNIDYEKFEEIADEKRVKSRQFICESLKD